MVDFNSQFKRVLKTVRSTINPEYAVPSDQLHDPVNVRITRLKAGINEAKQLQSNLSLALSKLETNLNALLEEVQPLLNNDKSTNQQQPGETINTGHGTTTQTTVSTGEPEKSNETNSESEAIKDERGTSSPVSVSEDKSVQPNTPSPTVESKSQSESADSQATSNTDEGKKTDQAS